MSACLVIQHVGPESAFAINDALVGAGVRVDNRRIFVNDAVPATVGELDGLVVMGGPMSAASDEGFASRDAELALIKDAVRAGIPTLGVCLGAQLVASATGGSVYPGKHGSELGWSVVTLTEACRGDPLFTRLPDCLTVLQWHSDTFDLPPDAVHLMENAVYPAQGFRVGAAAWGVQFHLEVDEPAVEGFLTAFGTDAELVPGGVDGIRTDTPTAVAALRPSKELILERFAALVAAH